MNAKSDISDFLQSRRARLTPAVVGLPDYGGSRRVPGLRREEVALLAGISVEYYTKLERGNATGVSDSVIDGLVRALQLDDVERAHLSDLVRVAASPSAAARRRPAAPRVRPGVLRILDAMPAVPAYIRNARMDILAANPLGRALYQPVYDFCERPVNTSRYLFLDPGAPRFFVDWDKVADDAVAYLRAEVGHNPYDRTLSDMIGELSTRSERFRQMWAAHNVRAHRSGVKRFHHPLVGDLTLAFEAFDIAADQGLRLNVYTAEPGSPDAEALGLLASWSAPTVRAPADPDGSAPADLVRQTAQQ